MTDSDDRQEEQESGGSLLDDILRETAKQQPATAPPPETVAKAAERGLRSMIGDLLPKQQTAAGPDKRAIDEAIARIDRKLGAQLDAILHHEKFQALEAAWRGLRLVVARADFRQGIKMSALNCSKAGLAREAGAGLGAVLREAADEVGGAPYAYVLANYEFGPDDADVALLAHCATAAAKTGTPFIAAASRKFVAADLSGFHKIKDIRAAVAEAAGAAWRDFRQSAASCAAGLVFPRFLLRPRYGKDSKPVKGLAYEERIASHADDYLWGAGSFIYAVRLASAFVLQGWEARVASTRPDAGVETLPIYELHWRGEAVARIPLEALIGVRQAEELAEEGFMPLVCERDRDSAFLASARTCHG